MSTLPESALNEFASIQYGMPKPHYKGVIFLCAFLVCLDFLLVQLNISLIVIGLIGLIIIAIIGMAVHMYFFDKKMEEDFALLNAMAIIQLIKEK